MATKELAALKRIKLKDKSTPSVIEQVTKSLKRGVVALPTEFNYVLVSTQRHRLNAIKRNLILNKNQELKPARFILKSTVDSLSLNESAQKIIANFLPGSLIALVPTRNGKIGIQVSNSPLINDLLARLNEPLYFIENEDADSKWLQKLENGIVLLVETELKKTLLSTIIDLSLPNPTIIRKGAIPILAIEKVLGEKVKLDSNTYFTVLLVCSGNSCRSPMAKGILEKMLEKKNVFVYSAGTIAISGNLASDFAVIAAQKYGADISHHLSAPLTKELINNADLILVMSPKHKDAVLELVPEAEVKTFLLREYAFGISEEVFDPIGQPLEIFEKVAAVINESLTKVAEDIKERLI